MIIFGEKDLHWIRFKDLPHGCHFTIHGTKEVHKKEYGEGFYGNKNVWIRPHKDIVAFAQVQLLTCAVAVRKADGSANQNTSA